MKTTMTKKVLTLVLVFCMTLASIQFEAWADGSGDVAECTHDCASDDSCTLVGETLCEHDCAADDGCTEAVSCDMECKDGEHADGCAYAEATCTHSEHDSECGYAPEYYTCSHTECDEDCGGLADGGDEGKQEGQKSSDTDGEDDDDGEKPTDTTGKRNPTDTNASETDSKKQLTADEFASIVSTFGLGIDESGKSGDRQNGLVVMTFASGHGSVDETTVLEAGKLVVKIEIPKGSGSNGNGLGHDVTSLKKYHIEETQNGESYDYLVITWNEDMPLNGDHLEAAFSLVSYPNGITDNGTQFTYKAQVYFDGTALDLTSSVAYTNIADHFTWSDITLSSNVSAINISTTGQTDIGSITYTYTGTENGTDKYGHVHTGSIAINDTYTLPMDGGKPALLMKVKQVGGAYEFDGDYFANTPAGFVATPVEVVDGYAKSFSVSIPYTSPDTTKALSGSLSFTLQNVTLRQDIADATSTSAREYKIINTGSQAADKTSTAVSAYDFAGGNTIGLKVTTTPVIVKIAGIAAPTVETPNLALKKGVYVRDSKNQYVISTSPNNAYLAGYEVTFVLNGVDQNLKNALDSFVITDSGFDTDELLPKSVYTGTYAKTPFNETGKIKITVSFASAPSVSGEYEPGTLVDLVSDMSIASADLKNITSIQLDYGKLASGVKLENGGAPRISFTMQNLGDKAKDGITNEASLAYSYQGKPYTADASAQVKYAVLDATTQIKNKDYTNLSDEQNSSGAPTKGDTLQFKLKITNNTQSDKIGKIVIHDYYTANLAPEPGTGANIAGMVVSDTNKYNIDSVTTHTVKVDGIDKSYMKIVVSLKNNGAFNPGDSFNLTYQMKVLDTLTEKDTVSNFFEAWGYRWSQNIPDPNPGTDPGTNPGTNPDPEFGLIKIDGGNWKTTVTETQPKPYVSIQKLSYNVGSDKTKLNDGEQIQYVITVTNRNRARADDISVVNLYDVLPAGLVYSEDTQQELKLTKNTASGTDAVAVTATVDGQKIIFKPEATVVLKTGEYLELSFHVTVKSDDYFTGSKLNYTKGEVTNTAYAYLTANAGDYTVQTGSASTNMAGKANDTAKSAISNVDKVTLINNVLVKGTITKTVTKNPELTLSDEYMKDTSDMTRSYKVVLKNTGVAGNAPYTVTKVLDQLPTYETVDLSSVKVTGGAKFTADQADGMLTITFTDNLTIKAAASYTITYNTVVDSTAARKALRDAGKYSDGTLINKAAMYLLNDGKLAGSTQEKQDSGANGSEDWDSDATTTVRYESAKNVTIKEGKVAPVVQIVPQYLTKIGNAPLTWDEYNAAEHALAAGSNIGWIVNAKTQANSLQVLRKGAKVEITVDDALTILNDSENKIVISAYVKLDSVVGNTITLTTLKDISTSSIELVRFITKAPNAFGTYGSSVKLTPIEEQLMLGSEITEWGNSVDPSDPCRFVSHADQVYVFGSFRTVPELSVTEISTIGSGSENTASSSGTSGRKITLDAPDSTFRYTMTVENKSTGYTYDGLVLVNRLPGVGDFATQVDKVRDSTIGARLVGDGSFVVAIDGTALKTTDYTIEYAAIAPNYSLIDDENTNWKAGGGTIWTTDPTGATAVRVVLGSHITLTPNQVLTATFDAEMIGEDFGTNTAPLATDSFGYAYNVKAVNVLLMAEPRNVGVTASNVASLTVTKAVENKLPNDETKTFYLRLLRQNAGGWQTIQDFALTVGGESSASESFDTLAPGTYKVQEFTDDTYTTPGAPSGFEVTYDGDITLAVDDAKEYTVTNRRIPSASLTVSKSVNLLTDDDVQREFLFRLFVQDDSGNYVKSTATDADFSLSVLGDVSDAMSSIAFSNLVPGTYLVLEYESDAVRQSDDDATRGSAPQGFEVRYNGDLVSQAIALDDLDNKAISITNTQLSGELEITKKVVAQSDTDSVQRLFYFRLFVKNADGSYAPFNGLINDPNADGAFRLQVQGNGSSSVSVDDLAPGTYMVKEYPSEQASYNDDNGTGGGAPTDFVISSGQGTDIAVTADGKAKHTITNSQLKENKAALTVEKRVTGVTNNNTSRNFYFRLFVQDGSSFKAYDSFNLAVTGTGSNRAVYTELEAGTYKVLEYPTAAARDADTNGTGGGAPSGFSVSYSNNLITLARGGSATSVITNTGDGTTTRSNSTRLTVEKIVEGVGENNSTGRTFYFNLFVRPEGDNSYTLYESFELEVYGEGSDSITFSDLNPGDRFMVREYANENSRDRGADSPTRSGSAPSGFSVRYAGNSVLAAEGRNRTITVTNTRGGSTTTTINDGETPLGTPTTTILDGNIPLGTLPFTGIATGQGRAMLAALMCLIASFVLLRKGKED